MSQFKPSFVKEIYDALKDSCFSIPDFEIEFPKTGKTLLSIKFKHRSNYSFLLTEETETNYVEFNDGLSALISPTRKEKNTTTVHYASLCPGEYKLKEKKALSSIDRVKKMIPDWCLFIQDDIRSNLDIDDGFSNLREQLEELISENITNEKEMFSNNELDNIKEKLDQLYSKFEDLKATNIITEKELKEIKAQLAEARENANSYPKALWARVTNNKLLQTLSDFSKSKEGRELLLEGIKKLFLN